MSPQATGLPQHLAEHAQSLEEHRMASYTSPYQQRSAMHIDHFHKWRPIINSFASIEISLTNLILKLVIQKHF